MPFVAVPNGAKVEHLATIYDRPVASVLGGVIVPPLEQADLDTATAALRAAWDSNMVPFAEGVYHYLGCRVTLLDVVDGLQSFSPASSAGAGSSDKNLPPSVSACISLRTASRSRRGRGRIFWPIIRQAGIVEAQTFTLSTTLITGLTSSFQGYLDDALATDVKPAVVSRADHLARPITSFSIDARVDHQRRRDG